MDVISPITMTEFQLSPSLPLLAIFLIPTTAYYVLQDYNAYKSLGPGGTPMTPLGYLRVKLLALFALRDPYTPAPMPPSLRPRSGYLSPLPQRQGPRPCVKGIAPHRQTTQTSPEPIFEQLSTAISTLAEVPGRRLVTGTSCLEKHGPGLFSLHPIQYTRHCHGEVCHAHPSDGSLHLTLHPADAALVLKNGWGERHPLARGGWFSRFVPDGFVMVYAPGDEHEVDIVREVVCAAVWWVGGVNVREEEGEQESTKEERKDSGVELVSLNRSEGEMQDESCRIPEMVQKV